MSLSRRLHYTSLISSLLQSINNMAVQTQSEDDIASKFPINLFPRIDGETTYKSINEMMQMLYANAATLPTMTGG